MELKTIKNRVLEFDGTVYTDYTIVSKKLDNDGYPAVLITKLSKKEIGELLDYLKNLD